MSKPPRPLQLETLAIHAGEPHGDNAPLSQPIVQTTTFRFASAAQVEEYAQAPEGGLFMYSRGENPTVRAAEQAVAAVQGTQAAIAFGSGMGAMSTALLGLASAGDEILASTSLYGATYRLLRDVLPRFGVKARWVAPEALAAGIAARPARLCVFETPTNPALRLVDVAAVAAACQRAGTVSVVDSTFGPPLLQRPNELGIDLVMHSATKSLAGHSEHLAGFLAGSRDLIARLRPLSQALGASMDPAVAHAVLRGLKTLAVRLERQCATSLRLARWLEQQPGVTRVHYPGLESHPEHALAQRQMSAGGAMVTFSVGTRERATRLWDKLQLIARAASLGDTDSLASLPILFSHTGYTAEELARAGVDAGMVRLSVGLEAADDLIADLAQALSA